MTRVLIRFAMLISFLLVVFEQKVLAQIVIKNESPKSIGSVPATIYTEVNTPIKIISIRSGYYYQVESNKKEGVSLNFFYKTKQRPIYAFANDTVYVSRDTSDKYVFKGKRANEWNFMANLEDMGYPLLSWGQWKFDDVAYNDYLTEGIKKRDFILNHVDKVKDSLQFSDEFVRLLKKDLHCAFVQFFIKGHKKYQKPDRESYQKIRNFLQNYEPFFLKEASRNSLTFFGTIPFWSIFLSKEYKNITFTKKSKTYIEQADYDLDENFAERFELVKTHEEPLKSELLFLLLSYRFNVGVWEGDEYEPYVSYFMTNCPDSVMKTSIGAMSGTYIVKADQKSYDEILMKSESLSTTLISFGGQSTVWKDILKQHKGKVIYFDFWASWCAPCRKEILASHETKKQLAAPDSIVFVNITIDEDKDAWLKAMGVLKMSEEFSKNYKLSLDSPLGTAVIADRTVPKYIIIDKKGRLRTVVAPRPSSLAFVKILDKLAKE